MRMEFTEERTVKADAGVASDHVEAGYLPSTHSEVIQRIQTFKRGNAQIRDKKIWLAFVQRPDRRRVGLPGGTVRRLSSINP